VTRDAERDILARIRHASRRADADTVRAALVQLPAVPAARLDDPDPLLAFVMRVLRNGGTAAVCSSRRDAVAAIGELVAERHGQRRVVAGHDARLAALPWRDGGLLPRFGTAEDGDAVTVSWAHRAVAETGSVLLAATAITRRATTCSPRTTWSWSMPGPW
jgi:L-lactate dehydrogenase complex protein LldG